MEDNPFAAIVKTMREDNKAQIPVSFRLGTVISTIPVKVDIAGIVQEEKDLLKNSLINFLNTGDRLLLIPIEDEQRYIIICKVVGI